MSISSTTLVKDQPVTISWRKGKTKFAVEIFSGTLTVYNAKYYTKSKLDSGMAYLTVVNSEHIIQIDNMNPVSGKDGLFSLVRKKCAFKRKLVKQK